MEPRTIGALARESRHWRRKGRPSGGFLCVAGPRGTANIGLEDFRSAGTGGAQQPWLLTSPSMQQGPQVTYSASAVAEPPSSLLEVPLRYRHVVFYGEKV